MIYTNNPSLMRWDKAKISPLNFFNQSINNLKTLRLCGNCKRIKPGICKHIPCNVFCRQDLYYFFVRGFRYLRMAIPQHVFFDWCHHDWSFYFSCTESCCSSTFSIVWGMSWCCSRSVLSVKKKKKNYVVQQIEINSVSRSLKINVCSLYFHRVLPNKSFSHVINWINK